MGGRNILECRSQGKLLIGRRKIGGGILVSIHPVVADFFPLNLSFLINYDFYNLTILTDLILILLSVKILINRIITR